jgi:hypothetical protein
MALFLGELVVVNIAALVAVLFVLAMILVVAGLVYLLREIGVATQRRRILRARRTSA